MTPAQIAEAATALVAHFDARPLERDAAVRDIGAYREVMQSIGALIPAASRGDAGSAEAANGIAELAAGLPATRAWMHEYVRNGRAPETLRIYDEPVGPPIDTSLAPRFVCPNGDFTFYRPTNATPVPPCPHDGNALVRA